MPPSAMTGTPCRPAARRAVEDRRDLRHADAGDDRASCRSSPGRCPTLTASAPALDQGERRPRRSRRCRRSPRRRGSARCSARDGLEHVRLCPWAVSTHEHVDARLDQRRGALDSRARADRRADPQPPAARPCRRWGTGCIFSMSLIVIRPLRLPSLVDHQQLLDRCACAGCAWPAPGSCPRAR